MNTMNTGSTYARSLVWIAILTAVAVGLAEVFELVFLDFVHGNPHRPKSNAIEMMWQFAPISALIAVIGALLVFTLPQLFQSILTDVLVRHFGRRGLLGVLLALPPTACLAWYCYDYLIPSNPLQGFGTGLDPDWTPYQHGLTPQRYLMMLAIQAPITLFGVLHCDAAICERSKWRIIIGALVFAVLVGVFYGHWKAEQQYRFL